MKKKRTKFTKIKLTRQKKGVTLLEILIGIVLVSIVSLFTYSIFSAQIRLFLTQTTGINISSQNKIALDELTNQTRQAQNIVASCPPVTCGSESATTGASAVVYKVLGLDASGNPTSAYYDYIVFKQSGTNLQRITYKDTSSTRGAGSKIIATDLRSIADGGGLSFTYNNSANPTLSSTVTFTVTTTKTESKKNQTISQAGTARLRNIIPPTPTPIAFNYPLQIGSGGFTSVASGDTYNGNIWVGDQSGPTADIYVNGSATVSGDAFATGIITNLSSTLGPTHIHPNQNPASVPAMPNINYQQWRDAAEASTTVCSASGNFSNSIVSIGPCKQTGDLSIDGTSIVTVTGTIWVTGSLHISGTSKLKLSDSFGSYNTVVIADGKISISGGSVESNNSTPKGYIILVSTDPSVLDSNPAFYSSSSDPHTAIFYAKEGMYSASASGAGHLTALVAKKATFTCGCINIDYDPALASSQILSSPR